MRLPADAALLIIDAQDAVEGSRHGAGDAPGGRDGTSPPLSLRGGPRGCRLFTSAGHRSPPLLSRSRFRRSRARSSSSATRQAPSSAPTLKRGSTNSARRRWSFAGRSRPMRSKRRRGTRAILAISCLSSPTRAGRLTRPISEGGCGRLTTCGRWRSRVSRARLRPLSTSRRRSEPPRRPRRASGAGQGPPDGADHARSWLSARRLAFGFRARARSSDFRGLTAFLRNFLRPARSIPFEDAMPRILLGTIGPSRTARRASTFCLRAFHSILRRAEKFRSGVTTSGGLHRSVSVSKEASKGDHSLDF